MYMCFYDPYNVVVQMYEYQDYTDGIMYVSAFQINWSSVSLSLLTVLIKPHSSQIPLQVDSLHIDYCK